MATRTLSTRTLPNSIEAEQAIISSMLLSKNALAKACEALGKEFFFLDRHAKIFDSIKTLFERKDPIDITTITTELKNRSLLQEIGGVEYLTEVLNSEATAANIDYYMKIVIDYALLRNLIETSTDIASMGYSSELSVEEILDDSEKKILSIVKNRRSTEFQSIQTVLDSLRQKLDILAENKGEITGLATGFIDLDKLTSGLHENQLIIIASRPGMGKTTLAINIATNVAINTKTTVAIFNLEMLAEQLASSMISAVGQVEKNKLQTGYLLNNDQKRVNEAMSQLKDAKIYIDDTPGTTIGEIRAKCRRLANSDEGLGLIIIDYLQLISGGKNYGTNRQQEVSDVSRSLKMLAMELKVPIIALAQLSRASEQRKEDKRPVLSDLRESGSIEQDADIVGLLYRDDYYNESSKISETTSLSELIIAKHRNGGVGKIELLFKRDMGSFHNIEKEKKGDHVEN